MVQNPFQEGVAVQVRGDSSNLINALDRGENALLGFGSSARLLGAGILAGALAAGFAAAVNEARQFEEAMVEVEKVTDPQTAEAMADEIMEMAETIPLAQEELANLTAQAARFGVRGQENIRAFSETVAKMAIATDLSSEQAGESLARLATLTQIPADEIERLGSAINELSNTSATSSQEIVDSMLRSAGALRNLGLTTTEIAGLSAALNEVSESSERAGTRLRRVAQELMDPGKVGDLAEALGMTTEAFEEMRDEEPAELIKELASTLGEGTEQSEMLASALSTTTRQALIGLSQNIEGVDRALRTSNRAFEANTSLQREFDAASDTLNSRLTILSNRVRELAIGIGTELLPAVKDLTNGLTEATDATIGFANALAKLRDRGKEIQQVTPTTATDEWRKATTNLRNEIVRTNSAVKDAEITNQDYLDSLDNFQSNVTEATKKTNEFQEAVKPPETKTIFDVAAEDAGRLLGILSQIRQQTRTTAAPAEAGGGAGIGFAAAGGPTGTQGLPASGITITVEGDTDVVKDVALNTTDRRLTQFVREADRLEGRGTGAR